MKIFSTLAIAMTLVLSLEASARKMTRMVSAPENEIQIGSAGNGSLLSEKTGGSTVTTISLRGSLAKPLQDFIQVGGELQFYSTSGGKTSTSGFDLVGFGTYNFDADFSDALYAKAGLGLFSVTNDKAERESKFGFFIGGGKRIPLFNAALTYNPEFRLYKKGDLDASFEIMLINFSVML